MNLPFIDRIWRVRGALPIDPPQSPEEAFAKLDPLFQTDDATYQVDGDKLTYHKSNPAAQDKMATFTSGTLQVVEEAGSTKLVYNLFSPALLACFLAPLLFIGFGQLFEFLNVIEGPPTEEARGADAEAEADEPPAELHWFDQMLGAPEPADPNAEDEESESEEGAADEEKEKRGKHSPTPSYVLAGLFAVLYLVGRWLEPWLIRRTFRKRLSGEAGDSEPNDQGEAQQAG